MEVAFGLHAASFLRMTETRDILDELKRRRVRFLLLQFTDLLGVNKAVEVPASRFETALAGEVLFDASALEGFARVEEADALLVPDLTTFRVLPPETGAGGAGEGDLESGGGAARLICDIRYPDGRPFEGCPRTALKRQLERAAALGFAMRVGCEVEFFLFERGAGGAPTTATRDAGGYFDLVPVDRAERARRLIVAALEEMGLSSEASHHEIAAGQYEVDLAATDPLTMADQLATLRFLHSTGQYHKGGPNTGLFLQLTADDAVDAAIPGAPYTFGVFKRAQALGDLAALRAHGRRVIRIHLGSDVAGGLRQLDAALAAALTRPTTRFR